MNEKVLHNLVEAGTGLFRYPLLDGKQRQLCNFYQKFLLLHVFDTRTWLVLGA